jgi:hypothetical protein
VIDPSTLDPSLIDPGAWWASLQSGNGLVLLLVELAVGLLLCFYGFRVFRAALTVSGFVAGAWAGVQLTHGGSPTGDWLLAVALGVAGALLAWGLYRLAGLLLGAGLGVLVLGSIGTALHVTADVQWLLLLIGLVLGAIAGWRIQTLAVVIGTALTGAAGVVASVAALLSLAGVSTGLAAGAPMSRLPGAEPPLAAAEWVAFGLVLALAGAGVLRQLRGRRRATGPL